MTNITLRSVKGSPLTNNEVDSNFNSLNVYKVELTDSTGSIIIPAGTTADRDASPAEGYLRYNTDTSKLELYSSSAWSNVGENISSISYNTGTGLVTLTTSDSSYTTTIDLQPFTTSDLDEGSNQYFTSARARTSISVTDAGGDGSLGYDNTSGVLTYTGPSASEVRAHFSAGTGLTLTDGEYSITNTGVSASTYGDSSTIPRITVNAQGQITGVTGASVNIPPGYDATNFDSDLATKTTDNLTEGSTNLYYDSARTVSVARNSVSVTDAGGDGSLSYNAGTGVLTYTGPSASEVRAHFSAGGNGIALTSGAIAIDSAANIIVNSIELTNGLIVGGDLQVNGTTTTVSTENLEVSDNMIYMNASESAGSPTLSVDVGWAANINDDGSYEHVGMFRDATDNTFKIFEGYTLEPDAAVEINTGHASFSLAPFQARTLSGQYLGFDSDFGTKTTSNLTEGSNQYYTDARARGALVAGTGITYTSGTGTIATNDAAIVHDNLSGFVANEHIDHSAVSIIAGNGLTGGGTIAASRTLNVGAGTGITVGADTISTNDAQIVHDNLSGFVANEHIDHSTVSISAGTGLTGGGTIAATRTLSIANTGVSAATYGDSSTIPRITVNAQGQITAVVGASVNIPAGYDATNFDSDFATKTTSDLTEGSNQYHTTARARGAISGGTGITYTSGTGVIATNDAAIVHDNLSGFVANEHIDHSTVSITAGSYLTGGGTIAATRTLNVDATSANTASKVVARDASGNFSAGTITATLSGNASTATALQTPRTIGGVSFDGTANINLPGVNATGNQNTTGSAASATYASAVTLTADNTTNATNYPLFANAATGNLSPRTDTGFTYNPSTGVLTSTTFSGALSGNASTATALQTARTIGGVSFDGTANINLPGVNTAGNQNTTGTAAGITGYSGTYWTSANDGAGTGLDADLLDGQHGSYYRIDVYNSAGTLLN